jgi:hypothetical protein
MIGMTADFPVRETPLMMFSEPTTNGTRFGGSCGSRGQRMSSRMWNLIGS